MKALPKKREKGARSSSLSPFSEMEKKTVTPHIFTTCPPGHADCSVCTRARVPFGCTLQCYHLETIY